ncbi:MAG: O-antigen polymerase [Candidatus Daviesbacteria bacterium GW2011_GWA1_36_8]|uniref:O-antigen polymerase n=2 Tax=Candidatus Daviesiibacteriota TaxID=1752718 RepID=A0A0G0F230_9BACT|nr:MAG: O-antigen polymerase [Candidatus Daviesbacteria bacterium GW2011_GWB1_36_5]KKQ15240.1 MAG: O-antigen polymerase [Candidatus Daviesbacteria bacterium GW2011_GWA1_36_8]
MKFYIYLTLIILIVMISFPKQINVYLNFIIYIYSLALLPVFYIKMKQLIISRDFASLSFFIFFLITITISTIYSKDFRLSMFNLLLYFAYFIIFFAIQPIFSNQRSRKILISFLIITSVVISAISLYNTLILRYVNKELEGVSFYWVYYGHNHLSALLVFVIPMAFYLISYLKSKYRLLYFLIPFFLIISLFFTFSRGSIIALIGSFCISLLAFKIISFKKFLLILFLGALSIFLFLLSLKQSSTFFNITRDSLEINSRLAYWNKSLVNWYESPIFGTGLDTTRYAKLNTEKKKIPDSYYSQNFFIQMLSDGGIFGFLGSFLLIFYLFWKSYIRTLNSLKSVNNYLYFSIWVGIFASLLNAMIDFDWQLPTVFLLFWILIGILQTAKKH